MRSPGFYRLTLSIIAGAGLLTAFALVFVAGLVIGNVQVYTKIAEKQSEDISELIDHHPQRFRDLRVQTVSGGWAHPIGKVAKQEDLLRLRNGLTKLFGEEFGVRMASFVTVEEEGQLP